jgi:hypothetical protein
MHRLRGSLTALTGASILAVAASAAAAPVTVGGGPRGGTAMTFTGSVIEAGRYFTFYGHLTGVRGWSDATVYAGSRTPARSRLTFVAITELQPHGRTTVGLRRFSVASRGQMRIFYQQTPQAAGEDPASYAAGPTIAVGLADLTALVVPRKARGKTVRVRLAGTMVMQTSRPFTVGGVSYQLGTRGLRVRLSGKGAGIVTDVYLPAARLNVAGQATVLR